MTNKKLLEVAKHVFENKKSDDSYVLFGNNYVYQAGILELVTKGLLTQKSDNYFLITSKLENFIKNKGKTNDEVLESEHIEREKETLKIAKEANKISKSSNNKAILSNIAALVSIVISIIAVCKS